MLEDIRYGRMLRVVTVRKASGESASIFIGLMGLKIQPAVSRET